MIKVKTSDGLELEARKWDDIVVALKMEMWIPPKTKEKYMAGVADRVEVFDGEQIKYHDSKSFLYELLRVGVLTEINHNGTKTTYNRRVQKRKAEGKGK